MGRKGRLMLRAFVITVVICAILGGCVWLGWHLFLKAKFSAAYPDAGRDPSIHCSAELCGVPEVL